MVYRKLFLHQETCGSVTDLCPKCNARYPRSMLSSHEASCNGTPVPPPTFNEFTPAKQNPYSYKYDSYKSSYNPPNQDIMICEKCQQALNSYEELQIHVFTEHLDNDDMPIATEIETKNTTQESETSPLPPTETSPLPPPETNSIHPTISSPLPPPVVEPSNQDNVTMTEASRPPKRPNEDSHYEEPSSHTNT